jgi:hypothetical protein
LLCFTCIIRVLDHLRQAAPFTSLGISRGPAQPLNYAFTGAGSLSAMDTMRRERGPV